MKKLTAIMMTLVFALSMILTTMPISATAQSRQIRNDFLIPDNTLLEARLNQRLQAERLGEGTRFTMTINSPRQFRGAVIEGYVEDARRSGRVSGRSEIVLNFDRIRHRGRTYAFAGTIDDVRKSKGERVEVDSEGSVREDSLTERTVGRSIGGAVIGTVIGTITGGGSGAAKGAIIGGGIGAGSVLVQGRNSLDLQKNTQFTLRSSTPR